MFDLGNAEPEVLAQHMHIKQDTVQLIQDLKAIGHRLVYLSNMPHGLSRWFEDGIFSDRVGLMKPDPAIFHLTAERLGIAEASPVFIDDALKNIDAAQALGWRGVRFESAGQVRDQLVGLGLIRT